MPTPTSAAKLQQVCEVREFATQYKVSLDGVEIGTVSRLFQDWRSNRPPVWQFENNKGGRGQVRSRQHAINSLLYLAGAR